MWQHYEDNDQVINNVPAHIDEALRAEETRPRFAEFQSDGGCLLIIRGVNLNPDAEPDDMVSVRIWLTEGSIVTLERRSVKSIDEIQALHSKKPVATPPHLMAMLLRTLFDKMQPIINELDEALDADEEKILNNPDFNLRSSIAQMRRRIIKLRRYLAPQREAMRQLTNTQLDFITPQQRRAFIECHDRIIRYVEDLDALRERSQVLQDEISNTLSEKLNGNLYFLAILSAIFLPLGVITGLLGINVGGMPGAENGQAFWVVCFILLVIVLAELVFFKRKKWF